ncbi:MAG: iron-containing alcohol dehydrogenase [Verrucomicrobia bacterium]|nr:iron-containing alcohol dehydrogenase [Verrucomicrobiota bacterium]
MAAYASRSITLSQPPLLSFGPGCAAGCPDELTKHGLRRVLLLTTASVAPLAKPLVEGLVAHGIVVTTITEVPAEPGIKDFERILLEARKFIPDGVVGFGDGNVLDIAKLVAALHDRAEPVQNFFGVGLLPKRRTFLVCLPTTAGTGSEVSPNAFLLDETELLKKSVNSPWLVPDAAFVDPLFTLSVPPAITAATGLDALVHCIEAYANRFAHPMVDVYALEGIRLISSNLLQAVNNGIDVPARTAVALGSLYGGMCHGAVNTGAVHALAYPLASEFQIAQELSNALILSPVLRFNLSAAPERYAQIARALGVKRLESDLATAEAGIAKLEELCDACGIRRNLATYDIPESAIPRLAAAAMKATRLLKNNPRDVTLVDAETLYSQAFLA